MTAVMSHNTEAGFELATAETWGDRWPMYAALRDHDPVHHVWDVERGYEVLA